MQTDTNRQHYSEENCIHDIEKTGSEWRHPELRNKWCTDEAGRKEEKLSIFL
jgi:hypothetical protein